MHEQVHVAIYEGYGIDSEVSYIKDFPDFVTRPEKRCPTEECELANNINEAISYVLMPVFVFFIIALTICAHHLDNIYLRLK